MKISVLRSLARREDSCGHGTSTDELAHGPVDPAHIEEVILLAFGQQDVLLDVVQDAVQRGLLDRGEEVEGRLRAGDVHTLDDTPLEYGAWDALARDQRLGPLAIAGLKQRDQLLRLPGPHLLQRHIEP